MSPPIKYEVDLFLKKSYSWQMGEAICFGQIFEGAVLQGGSMIRSCQGQGSFRNAISSNLKTINLKISPIKKGYILEDTSIYHILRVYRIIEGFILEVNS